MSRVSVVEIRPVRERVSEAEWQMRVDLAACYRLVARYGMTDLIYNHITARVPGEPGHILINPYGYLYTEIAASSLYKIDLDGNTGTEARHALRHQPCRLCHPQRCARARATTSNASSTPTAAPAWRSRR